MRGDGYRWWVERMRRTVELYDLARIDHFRGFEAAWETGELFPILGIFNDQMVNLASNAVVAEMIREKIRAIVVDQDTAEALCPHDHPFGTQRPCLDTGYFQTYNLPHVRLVDLRKHPIVTITESGIDTVDDSFEFDAVVYAIIAAVYFAMCYPLSLFSQKLERRMGRGRVNNLALA